MRDRLLGLAIAAVVLAASCAKAGPKEDAEARAALELALALQKPVAVQSATARLTFEQATDKANRDGKPVLIRVNTFGCHEICKQCSAQCTLADKPHANGDSTPRLILAFPKDGYLHQWAEWRKVPHETDVKAELLRLASERAKQIRRPVQANDLQ